MVYWLEPHAMLFCMFCIIATIRLSATVTQKQPQLPTYHVTRYTTDQGLPHNTVRALLQTSDGYLWVGTLAGLARFDGLRFKVFDMSNTPEMINDAIDALAEDRHDGSLWINAGQRVLRYYRNRFERCDEQRGFPHAFGQLWPARQGGLWYSPHSGQLALLQNNTAQTWQLRPRRVSENGEEIPAFRIIQVEEEDGGSVLVLMYCGLFRFVPEANALTSLGLPYRSDMVYRHFVKQSDGTIFVAAQNGLWRGNANRWDLIEPVEPNNPQCPQKVLSSGNGDLWIQWSDDGPPRVARFRSGHSEFLTMSNLPDYPMNQLLQDHERHLWIGTESGLCQLRPNAVRVYAREHGLRNDNVKSVAEGPDGTIWLGTAMGVSGIKDGQVTNLPAIASTDWGHPEVLLADRRGRVWSGAQLNSVAAFDRGAWTSPIPSDFGDSWVRFLYEDRSGQAWTGLDHGVAFLDEAGAVRSLPHRLSHRDVRVIHEDRRGDFWFGTYGGGLNRLHEGKITTYTTALGEYNNRTWWIHEDADGVFWVGTRNGLNRFVPPSPTPTSTHPPDRNLDLNPNPARAAEKESGSGRETKIKSKIQTDSTLGVEKESGGTFFTFTTHHGLHENIINNIQEDGLGYLWLSGQQGLYRVSRRELNDVAAGRLGQAQVLAFGEADGMLNSQCNGGVTQPSGCKDRAGRIWFPTSRGVAMVDPQTVRPNDVPPPVVIEQLRADDEVVFGDRAEQLERSGLETSHSLGLPNPTVTTVPDRTVSTRIPAGRGRLLEIRYTANSFATPHRVRFKYQLDGHDPDWRNDDHNRRAAFYTQLRPGPYVFRVIACNNHGVWSQTPAEFAFTLAPHFWQTWVFYLGVGAVLMGLATAVQAYRLRWQRRLLKLEHQQALADERTRIARDLHDDLGTALTGLALRLDVLRRSPPGGSALIQRLAESAANIRELAEHMREVVWAVNPRCDTVSSLASFLEQQAEQFLKAEGLRCRLEFPEDIPTLPLDGEARHQLALGVREALANAIRHAAATEIILSLRVDTRQLIVQVSDNGRGFDVAAAQAGGRGLGNMHARMQKIGGQCQCRSIPGAGTVLELRVPLTPPPASRNQGPA
jgi:signal transduction histidine kinase/ligand-binding sensor domain-containing protein